MKKTLSFFGGRDKGRIRGFDWPKHFLDTIFARPNETADNDRFDCRLHLTAVPQYIRGFPSSW